MRTVKFILLSTMALMVLACKENPKEEEEVVAEFTVNQLPNNSDKHFAQAITFLEENKNKEAAEHLAQGITALEKEGKEVSGLYKTNLDKAISVMKQIGTDLKNDRKVPVKTLREVIANAEINIAHEYLSTSDYYVLDEPEMAADRATTSKFKNHLANLKKEEGKMKEEAKEEGEALLDEGKKLEAEFKAWQEKATDYAKRSGEHLKKYYPEYYYEGYWLD